jgi:putative peptidoglycan lipid II flippase
MGKPRSLLRTVSSISLATGISRILGLVRDQVQAYFFGAGVVTDAFIAAFRIPNLLRDLFAEGALSSAFVPNFVKEKEERGLAAAWRLANRVITMLTVILGTLSLVIVVFAPWILRLYTPGFHGEKLELATNMTRILGPFLLFVALAAVAMGMLNSCGRFFIPALAPASFNVTSILGVILLVPALRAMGVEPGYSLAIGAIVGGAMQFLVQGPALRSEGFRLRPEWAPRDPGLRRVGRLMLPATFGLAATQINILVDTVLASGEGDGPITWLQMAFRLMLLPIGLFGISIATANLARVSHDAARGDDEALRANVARSLRAAAILTIPATAGLIALREPIVRILFEHGRFTVEDTAHTAAAVLCYALGLYAYAVTKIQVPTFYALGDARRPVIASAVAVGLKIAASLALLATFRRFGGVEPFLALALSTSLAAWANFTQLSFALRGKIGSLRGRKVLSVTLLVTALSAVMGVAAAWLHAVLETRLGGGGFPGELARLAAAIAVGIVITAIGMRVLNVPEARELWDRLPGPRS